MSSSRYAINPLVVLGVPTLEPRPLTWEWMDYYQSLEFGLGVGLLRSRIHGRNVADARNAIVQGALEQGAAYVLFISDDVLAPPNTFDLLRRHRADMVTGVYWTKTDPPQPYLFRGLNKGPYTDWTMGEYFPVDWAGCDCLLVHTDVFRAIEPPWFATNWTYQAGDRPISLATEDLYFYTKAKQAGFSLMCDSAVQCDHQDRSTGRRFGLTHEMPQWRRALKQQPADPGAIRVADLGCGIDTPWFGEQATVVRIDGDERVKPDIRCDLRAIPAADESFDIVHARHVLEHFMYDEAPGLLDEWTRILRVGGELRIAVPNLAYAAQEILRADADPAYDAGFYPLWQVFGRQTGAPGEVHRNGFTRHGLARLLRIVGLDDVRVEVTGEVGENLSATARKVTPAAPFSVVDKWQALDADAADLPVPPVPPERLNGARAELAVARGDRL